MQGSMFRRVVSGFRVPDSEVRVPGPDQWRGGYKRIATEEAWAPAELLDTYRSMASRSRSTIPASSSCGTGLAREPSCPSGWPISATRRIADMDSSGIDLQILSLTSPGVQVFDAATATSLAATTNDQVAEAVRKHPTRFAALGAVAPQDPKGAAREAERAVRKLGLKGIIINSHTRGEFLDDPKFWDISRPPRR